MGNVTLYSRVLLSFSHGNAGCSNDVYLLLFTIVIAYQALHRIIYLDTFASIYINTYAGMSPQYLQANACLPIFSQIYKIFLPPWELDIQNDGLLLYLLILFSIIFQVASYYLPCPICFCVSLEWTAEKLIFLAHFIDNLGE